MEHSDVFHSDKNSFLIVRIVNTALYETDLTSLPPPREGFASFLDAFKGKQLKLASPSLVGNPYPWVCKRELESERGDE